LCRRKKKVVKGKSNDRSIRSQDEGSNVSRREKKKTKWTMRKRSDHFAKRGITNIECSRVGEGENWNFESEARRA